MDIQILLNSVLFVFVMVRFASEMFSRAGVWKLATFLLLVMMANLGLMVERFGSETALYKAAMISLGFLIGTGIMAYAKRKERK